MNIVGSQVPSFEHLPDGAADFLDGEDAVDMAAEYGLVLDDWQAHMIRWWLARTDDGSLAASRHGASVPRQNGKNGSIEALELYEMVVLGRRILHTAHEVKTARKAFNRLLSFFDSPSFPDLMELVSEIRRTNGQEAIYLTNGGSVEFIARSKGSGRGFTVDTIILDEAQELSDDALEALKPTTIAAPSGEPREIQVGTPPKPINNGEVFTRFHEEAHDGGSKRVTWMEWSADEDDDPSDPKVWAVANPALGIRLKLDSVEDEYNGFARSSFQRERLGIWDLKESDVSVLDQEDWESCLDENIFPDGGEISLSVDVAPSRKQASVVAAGTDAEGNIWVDVIQSKTGHIDWIVPLVSKICREKPVRAVMIDSRSPAGTLIDALMREKIEVTPMGTNYVTQATGAFYDLVVGGRLRHLGQSILTAAALSATRRKIGDSWGWNRNTHGTDITPLVAATLAAYGVEFTKAAKPVKKVGRRRRKVRMMV